MKKMRNVANSTKDIVSDEERVRLSNLANIVNYPIKDFTNMNAIDFAKHKKTLTHKVLAHFDDYAVLGTAGIIEIAGFAESTTDYLDGYQKTLMQRHTVIKQKLQRVMLRIAKDTGADSSNYLNEYMALGLGLGLPAVMVFLANISKKRKKTQEEEGETTE